MSIPAHDLPESWRRKLPRYPMLPVTLLSRLAVGLSCQGENLGELLLIDTLQRSFSLSHSIGSVAVFADAKNGIVAEFYKRYHFQCFPDYEKKLFLPMKTVSKIFAHDYA